MRSDKRAKTKWIVWDERRLREWGNGKKRGTVVVEKRKGMV